MSALKARYRQLAMDSRQEKGLSFPVLFWLFIAGSLMGFVMEGVWHCLRTGSWGFRVATLWGPFCVIYGVGAAAMYLIALAVEKKPPLIQFAVFALVGSAVEYLSGLFQEVAFGTVSWDYSHHAINLGGRVSLQMTILWGLIGMVLMYGILPPLLSLFNRVHLASRTGLCRAAAAFMAVNLLMTSAALSRWQERAVYTAPASNAMEAWLDAKWPDERLQERFPNMVFVSQTDPVEPSPEG